MLLTKDKFPFIMPFINNKLEELDISFRQEEGEAIAKNIHLFEWQIFSQPFIKKAYSEYDNFKGFFGLLKPTAGCLLEGNHGIFYVIKPKAGAEFQAYLFLGKELVASINLENLASINKDSVVFSHDCKEGMFFEPGLIIGRILILNAFKQFSPIDAIDIFAKKGIMKIKILNIKYMSDLPIKITHYDSSWFRKIMIDREFGVRGHFRLQQVGKGRSELRYITVKAYKKQGYHRSARKEIS